MHSLQSIVIIILFFCSIITAGYLLFIAAVLQPVMNTLPEAEFASFLGTLYKKAIRSITIVGITCIASLGPFIYWYFYGLGSVWFSAGMILFLITGTIAKFLNLPLYKRVSLLDPTNVTQLQKERQLLQIANWIRAILTMISVIIMAIGVYHGQ